MKIKHNMVEYVVYLLFNVATLGMLSLLRVCISEAIRGALEDEPKR